MSKLICEICGEKKEIPACCDESMIIKGEMLCYCSDECHHRHIPQCCGADMKFI